MKFDRAKFFSEYQKQFGKPDAYQKAGLERLLWGFETYYGWWTSVEHIANAFAQVKHETAHTFNPVVEGYYLAKTTPPDYQGKTRTVKNFHKKLWYYPHVGLGDIQLTHAENYEEQDALIRKYFPEIVEDFEQRTGQKFNLIKNPEQALDGKISFCIFTVGMNKGTFTGKKLKDYDSAKGFDHFNARSIVNGDKNITKKGVKIGDAITAIAEKFEKVLNASKVSAAKSETENQPSKPELNPSDESSDNSKPEMPPDGQKMEPETPTPSEQPKEVKAPEKEHSTTQAAGMTIAGFAVPTFMVAIIQTIKDSIAAGYFDARQVGDVVMSFILSNAKYVFLLIGAIIMMLIAKKAFKQITLWIQMYILARPDLNDVKVIKQ